MGGDRMFAVKRYTVQLSNYNEFCLSLNMTDKQNKNKQEKT